MTIILEKNKNLKTVTLEQINLLKAYRLWTYRDIVQMLMCNQLVKACTSVYVTQGTATICDRRNIKSHM